MNEDTLIRLLSSRPAKAVATIATIVVLVLLFIWVFTQVEPAGASVLQAR